MNPVRLMICAGEASGDLHGSYLCREIRRQCPEAELKGMGGDLMAREGVDLAYHVRDLAVMGFSEVLRCLPFFFGVLRDLKRSIREHPPSLLILIDYPGLNIRLARFAKSLGIPVLYYISPQVWAWGRRRIPLLARSVDRMVVILDFEKTLYMDAGLQVDFFGHPLVEELPAPGDRTSFLRQNGFSPERTLLTLLPGSRSQEVRRILPVMARASEHIAREAGEAHFAVAAYSAVNRDLYESILAEGSPPVRIIKDRAHSLIAHSDFLIAASGTATLEAAFYGTPLVIVYRTTPLTGLLGRFMIKIPSIGLVNIIAGERIVHEFVQAGAKPELIARTVVRYLRDDAMKRKLVNRLKDVRLRMGESGVSRKTAALALGMIGQASVSRSGVQR